MDYLHNVSLKLCPVHFNVPGKASSIQFTRLYFQTSIWVLKIPKSSQNLLFHIFCMFSHNFDEEKYSKIGSFGGFFPNSGRHKNAGLVQKMHKKLERRRFRPAFGLRSTQMLVEIKNTTPKFAIEACGK